MALMCGALATEFGFWLLCFLPDACCEKAMPNKIRQSNTLGLIVYLKALVGP